MSMSVVCEGCGLEYAGALAAAGLFPTPRNLARPRYLYMLTEILRFHRRARAELAAGGDDPDLPDRTLNEFLAAGRFTRYFVDHFMTPMVACVWSCAPETAGRYPARYLFSFLDHHGMLSIGNSPQWRTVTGGSRTYVDRVAKTLTAVRTSTPVTSLRRMVVGVELVDGDGEVHHFDAAVVATHPDQALNVLAQPTQSEQQVLGAIAYSRNETLLHSDTSVLPTASRAHASWNYRMEGCRTGADQVQVSYDMNRLQCLDARGRYLVTLGGRGAVDPATVIDRMVYDHPIYTPESVTAQKLLPELDDDRIVFAGAYHGWGFHEDGARSGRSAAQRLGSTW